MFVVKNSKQEQETSWFFILTVPFNKTGNCGLTTDSIDLKKKKKVEM